MVRHNIIFTHNIVCLHFQFLFLIIGTLDTSFIVTV